MGTSGDGPPSPRREQNLLQDHVKPTSERFMKFSKSLCADSVYHEPVLKSVAEHLRNQVTEALAAHNFALVTNLMDELRQYESEEVMSVHGTRQGPVGWQPHQYQTASAPKLVQSPGIQVVNKNGEQPLVSTSSSPLVVSSIL